MMRLLKISKPELGYIVIGIICAAIIGSAQPIYAVFMSEQTQLFFSFGNH